MEIYTVGVILFIVGFLIGFTITDLYKKKH